MINESQKAKKRQAQPTELEKMPTFTRENADGSISIESHATFMAAIRECDPFQLKDISDFFDICENLIASEAHVSTGAISNVRGAWYEWLIALHAIKFSVSSGTKNILVKLPNVTAFDCAKLFKPEIFSLIEDLRHKVRESNNVSLITSNPDFCIVRREIVEGGIPDISDLSSLDDLDRLFTSAIEKCDLDDIVGYVAVKTSLRPDRRLQIPHEGSLMKALYRHIQTRNWVIDAPGVKFYAFTRDYTDADARALKTVATHSITDVSSKPQSAVDEIFRINCSEDAFATIKQVCT